MIRRAVAVLPAIWLATCIGTGPAPSSDRQTSQLQRDSAVAKSSLPGANAVDRALGALEAANAHAAAIDSIH
jgi:hypothetical protein